MTTLLQYPAFLGGLLDPEAWINWFGTYAVWGAALVIFIECWLFPFLPGDSLLFTAGVLIAGPGIPGTPLWLAFVIFTASAILSNIVGYGVGYKLGPKLFDRPDSRLFKREHMDRTHDFFERHGPQAIILARFVPIVRTFITLAAGAGRMSLRRFVSYSAIGAVLWVVGVMLLGYFLGQIPWLANHVEAILVGMVAFSVVPVGWEWWRNKRDKKSTAGQPASPDSTSTDPTSTESTSTDSTAHGSGSQGPMSQGSTASESAYDDSSAVRPQLQQQTSEE